MTPQEFVYKQLEFLISDFGFKYSYKDERGDHYTYGNKYGEIVFYKWLQFRDEAIYVKCAMQNKKIDLYLYYPQIYGEFINKHKGVKGFFRNREKNYWRLVSQILKKEIEKTQSIFGLPVEKLPLSSQE